MDDRLSTIQAEVDAGTVTPQSLVLLFNVASDADHAGDIATLEQTLSLARAVADGAGEVLRVEAERLAAICEQTLADVRQREAGGTVEPADAPGVCPDCGSELPVNVLRCRRCGRTFF